MNIISAKNLSFSYSNNSKVLNDVSFDIEKGSYTAIVGSNGSGKSTLARIICGLLKQDEGIVEIASGIKIGLVFQSPKEQLVSSIVYRDTAFGPQNLNLSSSEVELRTIESLTVVDMLEKAESATSALSLGQTQKIALSGMLAIWPEVLILDEAVSMIDPDSRENIFEFLRYWHKEGNTIIHITHDLDAIKEANNVIGINKGNVFYNGTCCDFFNNPEYEKMIKGPAFIKNRSLHDEKEFPYSDKKISMRFADVFFHYSDDDYQTLSDLSFNLYKGTLTALTGASGAGKSTIMELACGLLKKDSGEIFSEEKPVLAEQNCESALFENFVVDDVAFGPKNQGIYGKELKKCVIDSLDEVDLPFEQFKERQTAQLSGGEKRRLGIAGILAMNKNIIFFDEPTAGLDGNSRYKVMMLLKKLAEQGKTVVFSTHKRDEARFADREINIEKGQIVFDSFSETEALFESELKANSKKESLNGLSELKPYGFEQTLTNLRKILTSLSGVKRQKQSFIEKIPSILRILIFLVLFICSLSFYSAKMSFVMLCISILYCCLSGFSLKKLFVAAIKILPFLLFFSIFQMIFHPAIEGEMSFTTWKWFYVTPSKLWFCLATILKTNAALACISAFFVSTPEYDLIDGLSLLLRPLSFIKVPVRYFILIIEIIFRFIPLLVEEASCIIKTQIIRGSFGKVNGIFNKIKAIIPMIVPLIIQTVKRSEALADAITMRCFK